jgi:hypothetical protein
MLIVQVKILLNITLQSIIAHVKNAEMCGIKMVNYHRNGDLPAWIEYHDNRQKSCEKWYKNDKLHRDNKLPAWIDYKENGAIFQIKWLENVEYGGKGEYDVSDVKNTILNKICNKIKNYCLDR